MIYLITLDNDQSYESNEVFNMAVSTDKETIENTLQLLKEWQQNILKKTADLDIEPYEMAYHEHRELLKWAMKTPIKILPTWDDNDGWMIQGEYKMDNIWYSIEKWIWKIEAYPEL